MSERANLIYLNQAKDPNQGKPRHGGTVYLTVADEEGIIVSFIQSNYFGFGSGIVVPNTGISLQNRVSRFTLEEGHPNQVGPNKRPFHTIIPAFAIKDNEPLMNFGVMGGPIQPQGHAQIMTRIFEYRQNLQTALNTPRWLVMEGLKVRIESGFKKNTIDNLIQKDITF